MLGCGRRQDGCLQPSRFQSPSARGLDWARVPGSLRPRPAWPSSSLLAICSARSEWSEARLARATATTRWTYFGSLWNHAAFEHFAGDGSRYLVDECRAHLRIGLQHLESFLFHLRFRSLAFLGSLLPQLFAGRCLVLLDHLVGNPVHDRELLSVYSCAKQSDRCREQGCKYNSINHALVMFRNH